MKVSLLYRTASVLLLLFAAGHTIGFRQVDPAWHADSLVDSMKSMHFNANGSDRTYWEFFVGFGLSVTASGMGSSSSEHQQSHRFRKTRPRARITR